MPTENRLAPEGAGVGIFTKAMESERSYIFASQLGRMERQLEECITFARQRQAFGKSIGKFQSVSNRIADMQLRLETARLMLYKACWLIDRGEDFREASSLAKYLSVEVAREVTLWAADIFGAASVIREHPIHKYPMDVWGSSLGEGTQDVQKLIIFREVMKRYR